MTTQSHQEAYSGVDPSRKDCFKKADKSRLNIHAGLLGGHGIENRAFSKEILGPLLSFVDEARTKGGRIAGSDVIRAGTFRLRGD